eukprot:gene13754-16222_t
MKPIVQPTPELVAQMEKCLLGILEPNTEIIAEATKQLNPILKSTTSMLVLLQFLQNATDRRIRHLSAVLLRKKLVVHYIKLDAQYRTNMKIMMLDLVAKDADVRRPVAEIIIIIARIDLLVDGWDELLPFLFQMSLSPDAAHRDTMMHICGELLHSVNSLGQHVDSFVPVFKRGLEDPELKIRSATLRAIGEAMLMSDASGSIIAKYAVLIPQMLQVLALCIQNEMEDDVFSAFEVFDELAEGRNKSVTKFLPSVVQFSIEVASNTQIESSMRTSALEFIESTIQHKHKLLANNNLVQPVLQLLFRILANESRTRNDVEGDDEDNNLFQSAGIALRHCGELFSSKLVFEPVVPMLREFSASPEIASRTALPLIIQQLSYGCAEEMRDHLDTIVALVARSLSDADKIVRQNACVCVARLSDNVAPEIYQYANVLFPPIFSSLDDPDDAFILRCCFALENFLSNLEQDVLLPLLPALMDKMGSLLARKNVQVREFALSTVCALALASETHFAPYFNGVISFIRDLLPAREPNMIPMRANAIECMGALVKTVDKSVIQPLLNDLILNALDGVNTLGSSELNEATFSFYSTVFEHFGDDMAVYLEVVLPQLIKAAMSDDGVQRSRPEDQVTISGIDNDEDSDNDENDLGDNISIRTSFLDEKCAAIHAIGVIAAALPESFMPYSGDVIGQIEVLAGYFHEDVRFEALIMMQSICIAANECFPSPAWAKGDFQAPISEQMRVLLDFSFQIYLHILQFEAKKSVVSRCFGCIADTVALLGPGAIFPYLQQVGEYVMLVVKGGAYCQTATNEDTPDDEDEEDPQEEEQQDDEDEEESDYNLLHYASECMIEIATAIGSKFKLYLEAALPPLLKLTRKSNHHSIRSCVVGTIAEILKVIECDVSGHFEKLYTLGVSGLADESHQVRRVSCFLLGILISTCVGAKKEHYMKVLQNVVPLIKDAEQPAEVSDNAIGCVCRLISANAANVPINDVLPIIFSRLPIKKDLEEIGAVFNALYNLYSSNFDIISPFTSNVISTFAIDLAQKKLDEKVRAKIVSFIRQLGEKFGQQLEQIINGLPEDQRNTIISQLQQNKQ